MTKTKTDKTKEKTTRREGIRSKPWCAHLTENVFKAAARRYGKLAENLGELASRVHFLIDRLHETESNVCKIIIIHEEANEIYAEDSYMLPELVKRTLNIHYSALKLKPLIEMYVGEDEAKVLYYRLRRNLALREGCHYNNVDNSETDFYGWTAGQKYNAQALAKNLERLSAFQVSDKSAEEVKYSLPLSMNKWASILGLSENKMKEIREAGDKYHFDKVSARKWRLPENELPAEYLEKYRAVIRSKPQ